MKVKLLQCTVYAVIWTFCLATTYFIDQDKLVPVIFDQTTNYSEETSKIDAFDLLAKLVEAEAGNQDLIGRRLVVSVVLNRVDSEDFPDDIISVILQENQFAPVKDGRLFEITVSEKSIEAVKLELENRTDYDVLYFRTGHFHKFAEDLFKHGDHYFSK